MPMKEQKLGIVSPHFFEDFLILSLSKHWINYHGQIPCFDIVINKEGRLCLIGPKVEGNKDEL